MSGEDGGRWWCIDALDADAGIAFASAVDGGQVEQGEGHAVVIAPPYFRPEPVSGRALSLAAMNRGAQPGVFIEGEAVRFSSLAEVVVFVRSTYIAGGAGGGSPGDVPPSPQGPDGGEPPSMPDEFVGSSANGATEHLMAWLSGPSGEWLEGGAVGRQVPAASGAVRQVIAEALCNAAGGLVETMPPGPVSLSWWAAWERCLRRFRFMASFLNVTRTEASESARASLGWRTRAAMLDPNHWLSEFRHRGLTGDEHLVDIGSWMLGIFLRGHIEAPSWAPVPPVLTRSALRDTIARPEDPFTMLASLPVSLDTARRYALGPGTSIADILARCCGTKRLDERDVGLLVMAACFIVGSSAMGMHADVKWPSEAWGEALFDDAMNWLKRQLQVDLPQKLIALLSSSEPSNSPHRGPLGA